MIRGCVVGGAYQPYNKLSIEGGSDFESILTPLVDPFLISALVQFLLPGSLLKLIPQSDMLVSFFTS